jgi:hypothetical protein
LGGQGYLSFWNDNISYALRGCIVLELALRGRISMQKDPSRRRFPLPDRVIEVIDDTLTGEVLLDEALKMMKASEKMSVSSWIDLMSGVYALGLKVQIQTLTRIPFLDTGPLTCVFWLLQARRGTL